MNEPSIEDVVKSSNVDGRMFFPGNPWPEGHRVASCEIIAAIDPHIGLYTDAAPYEGPGMSLSIELQTADYDEDDPSDRDGVAEDDWSSKIVWNNYGSCSIGESQSSNTPGFRVSDGKTPFSFDLGEYRFVVDPLPLDWDAFMVTRAFGIYLLGHDAIADINIHLHGRLPDGSYTLDWTGRIAQSYVGKIEFTHEFHAHITGVRFKEIRLWYFDKERAREYKEIEFDPTKTTPRDYIAPFVVNPDAFRFEERDAGLDRTCVFAIPIS